MTNDTGSACQFQFFIDGGSTAKGKTTATWGTPTGGVSDSTHSPFADYAGNYIGFTNVDIYPGAAPRPFNPPLYHDDLTYCQRYYFRQDFDTAAHEYIVTCNVTSATLSRAVYWYPQVMRAVPSLSSSAAATWNVEDDDGTNINVSSIGLTAQVTPHNISVSLSFAGSATVGAGQWKRDGTDTSYIIGDADL